MNGQALPERLLLFCARANTDAELGHISRGADVIVRAECIGGTTTWMSISAEGVAAETNPLTRHSAETIVLRAPVSAWAELADPDAAPRRHDLLALTKAPGGIEIVEGRTSLIRHLRVLNRIVEIGRSNG
ncbi:hypothetical protein D4765_17830 [Subtercola vilae]|uniref:Uncharacterized protein n=2 Tax=Subtercola vilae TaxID=2056433 RepID=A0A4T2BG00_9MICO|nr:hypothetical protein D4765_17830 [Subtercola vilae]